MTKYERQELLDKSHEELAEICLMALQATNFHEQKNAELHQRQEAYSRQLFQFSFDRSISILNMDKKAHTLEEVLELAARIEEIGNARLGNDNDSQH